MFDIFRNTKLAFLDPNNVIKDTKNVLMCIVWAIIVYKHAKLAAILNFRNTIFAFLDLNNVIRDTKSELLCILGAMIAYKITKLVAILNFKMAAIRSGAKKLHKWFISSEQSKDQ